MLILTIHLSSQSITTIHHLPKPYLHLYKPPFPKLEKEGQPHFQTLATSLPSFLSHGIIIIFITNQPPPSSSQRSQPLHRPPATAILITRLFATHCFSPSPPSFSPPSCHLQLQEQPLFPSINTSFSLYSQPTSSSHLICINSSHYHLLTSPTQPPRKQHHSSSHHLQKSQPPFHGSRSSSTNPQPSSSLTHGNLSSAPFMATAAHHQPQQPLPSNQHLQYSSPIINFPTETNPLFLPIHLSFSFSATHSPFNETIINSISPQHSPISPFTSSTAFIKSLPSPSTQPPHISLTHSLHRSSPFTRATITHDQIFHQARNPTAIINRHLPQRPQISLSTTE